MTTTWTVLDTIDLLRSIDPETPVRRLGLDFIDPTAVDQLAARLRRIDPELVAKETGGQHTVLRTCSALLHVDGDTEAVRVDLASCRHSVRVG